MDVLAVQGGRREGRRALPRGQGPVHPGDEDLPLSRPLDVRPGEVPHAGGSAEDARRDATRSSMCATLLTQGRLADRGRAEGDRQGDQGDRATRPPSSPRKARSRTVPSSGPTSTSEGRQNMATEILMPALSPTMDGGQAGQVAGEGRRHGQVRRQISPRSRPTRRRWSSRRSTRARSASILVAEGTEGVQVNTPIAVLVGRGRGASARACDGGRRRPRQRPSRDAGAVAAAAAGDRRRAGQATAAAAAARAGLHRPDQDDDRARGAARRHGRGDARATPTCS